MRKMLSFVSLAASLALLGAADPAALDAPPASAVISYSQPVIAIEHVRVIDGTGAAPAENQTVVVKRGKIVAYGASARTQVPAGATVIDGTGKTLTPGFVGTHDHLYYVSGGPLFVMREMPYSFPRMYLAGGVTTIRTTGSVEPYTDLHIKRSIDKGDLVGPHLDVTSAYLTGYEPFFVQMGDIETPELGRRTVDFWADQGMTSFKLYMQIKPSVAQAIVNEAHKRHLKVLGHLCTIGFAQASKMGVDSLEHGLFVDTEFTPGLDPDACPTTETAEAESIANLSGTKMHGLIALLVKNHTAVSSTLANFEGRTPPPMRVEERMFALLDPESKADVLATRAKVEARPQKATDLWRREYAAELRFEVAFFHAGGLLTQGPDPTGYGATIAGIGDQRDIELLVKGGLTPVEAIQVATLNGAKSLGRDKTIGSIAVGKNADLVLIDGNPAATIDDIENVVTVFKDGVGYDSKKLFASVKGIVGRQ
ncbi:MAG TPA: amidohydrolase family protein [Candidatus Aquilonibacter sp.]|nr:amidohydrolase family protein [Candidatus Aquilonibacter sp.]